MYKTLGIAVVLLAAFAFTSGSRSADASATAPISPPIVSKGKLLNQTAPIPTTTIFTPTQTGLYRLSAYATITKADPTSSSSWNYNIGWTDDAGAENYGALFSVGNEQLGPFQWNQVAQIGTTVVFEAKAGTAVTYNVTESGPSDSSEYLLYYTLERLE